jgi:hypothetical protein
MKFTAAFLVAAHAAAKANTATLSYRQRLSIAMKAAYAAAKAPKVEEQVVFITVGYGKASMPASYKQYDYLMDLANCLGLAGLNSTQFCKRVNSFEASEAIGLAKAGRKVEFVLA